MIFLVCGGDDFLLVLYCDDVIISFDRKKWMIYG